MKELPTGNHYHNHQQMRGDMDKKLDELLDDLERISHHCGEFNITNDAGWEDYEDLVEESLKARQAIIDYFEKNQPTER